MENNDLIINAQLKLLERKKEIENSYNEKIDIIRKYIYTDNYELARKIGLEFSGTSFFSQIKELFESNEPSFYCNGDCDERINAKFIGETLSWIAPSFCDTCEKAKRNEKKKKIIENYPQWLKANVDYILDNVGIGDRDKPSVLKLFPHYKPHAKKYISGDGIFITGGYGTGKTWLAVAFLKHIMKQEEPVYDEFYDEIIYPNFKKSFCFKYIPSLLHELQSCHNSNVTLDSLIDFYSNIKYLVLDDIGVEKPTEWVKTIINTIVHNRYSRKKFTIYTSNLSLEELGQHIDERIASRINGQCQSITLSGNPDKR